MTAPDFHGHVARFFLLAEQVSRLEESQRRLFWHGSALRVQEPAAHLPALVNAVRREDGGYILHDLAGYPLPAQLSPETVPWHDDLVAAWEVHRASDYPGQSYIALLAQVRLDGCGMPEGMTRPSRLPEWLAEARQIAGSESVRAGGLTWIGNERGIVLVPLAALAAWRPAPGVTTDPETLRDWVVFWLDMHRSGGSLLKGIAAKALLNLPEADLRAASIPTIPARKLMHELAKTISVQDGWTSGKLDLVGWQPAEGMSLPADGMKEIAYAWLEVARRRDWQCRETAWQQLANWERAGNLTACGINLLPNLLSAIKDEKEGEVLLEMAHWTPAGETLTRAQTRSDVVLLQELEIHWRKYRKSERWLERQSGWLGSIHLHQAGLATESQESLLRAYLSAAAGEISRDFLFILGQWSPGPDAPPAVHQEWQQDWQHRMEGQNENNREVATFALLRQALENETEGSMRDVGAKTWRAKTMDEATQRLEGLISRFHEVRAQLAAGILPDFEDGNVSPSAERQRPRLVLPSERRESGRWEMGSGELKIER